MTDRRIETGAAYNGADTGMEVVRTLVSGQFPRWCDRPIHSVASSGTDNALYRLGDDLVVRLPRVPQAAEQVSKEHRWLPVLAPRLPLAIPEPVAMGEPQGEYPYRWSIYRWIDGHHPAASRIDELDGVASALGAFVRALRTIDASGGPPPGAHNFFRGVPLAERDEQTREAIASLDGQFDGEGLRRAWEDALSVPAWTGPAAWIHGDLHSENLLAQEGRLTAVIDFGGSGVGDPACDALAGWLLFTTESRAVFRETGGFDDDSWARGRGWALSVAAIILPYYRGKNPKLEAIAEHGIVQVLSDSV